MKAAFRAVFFFLALYVIIAQDYEQFTRKSK